MFSIEDHEGSNQLKIALAQMDVISNKPNKNLESMLNMIGRAKTQDADLVAFPEMCLGGYLLSDKCFFFKFFIVF